MESQRELYRIAGGLPAPTPWGLPHAAPCSAGPFPQAERFQAVLYGSLAKTGKGHLTDRCHPGRFCAPAHGNPLGAGNPRGEPAPTPTPWSCWPSRGRSSWAGGGCQRGRRQNRDRGPALGGRPRMCYPPFHLPGNQGVLPAEGEILWQYVEENEGP